MSIPLRLRVNNTQRDYSVDPRVLLVHYLRDHCGLTGTHVGCETSICGACTVLVDGKAVKSCTMFAVQADGCEVTTIEGIATTAAIVLAVDGDATRIACDADVQVGGLIAAIGSRLVEAAAKKLADDFFKALSTQLTARTDTIDQHRDTT